MAENLTKTSDISISSELSEKSNQERNTLSSKVPTTSSSIPLTSNTYVSSSKLQISENEIENEYKKINCNDEKYYSTECNKFLLKKELVESEQLSQHAEANPYLYPNLNDKEFNIKIATKKEFNDTKYDGTIYDSIKEQADILAKADFELQPHQAFVKNFMSYQTPYSSLLLYHGLGSGKTCSAIVVC